eukprot:CAMPEP_0115756642 /NCGR_PEP_ID=MMETSP0272-20121206/98028_1 /TAXON_ID=71861 /ORGANISM="Scrippsiella trochoidea, Strain CCMP3099" /LENGTH=139 /DNA_ID=CAMNT_0003202161 /DNA_START=301 /DNA_END=717 /DNA_ORIENTATION=-
MSVLQHVELPSRLAAAGDALGFVSAKLAADLTGPPASDHQHSTIPRCSSHVLWLGEVDAMTAAASTMPDCQTSMIAGSASSTSTGERRGTHMEPPRPIEGPFCSAAFGLPCAPLSRLRLSVQCGMEVSFVAKGQNLDGG